MNPPDDFSIRLATEHDLTYVITLQDHHRHELGFLHPSALEHKVARRGILLILENDTPAGYINFTNRRDHLVHILQVAVTEELWRNGHGSAAIDFLAKSTLEAGALHMTCRTAEDLPANKFWPTLGFKPHGSIQGPRRRLNRWSKRLSNIIVPGVRQHFPFLRRKYSPRTPSSTLT